MELMDSIVYIFMETIKYFLITYGVLGFDMRKGKKKYLVLMIPLIVMPIQILLSADTLWFRTVWGLVFLLAFFEGRILKKVQGYIIECMVISTIDLMVWSIYVVITGSNVDSDSFATQRLSEFISIILLVALSIALRKFRKTIGNYFQELSIGYFCILFTILVGMAVMVSCMQISLFNETTEDVKRVSLMASVICMVIIIAGCIVFIYMVYTKNRMELINNLDKESMQFQKKYYDKLLKQDEGTRRFRHDMVKHMNALKVLCYENKIDEVKTYIEELTSEYINSDIVHTGNSIADYFISATIDALKEEGELEYKVLGRFPENLKISSSDMCILLANALDNAKEALVQIKGERKLFITIKNFQDNVFVTVANSAEFRDKPLLETQKEDKSRHGYGTKNMKSVVEKYDGEIEWKYEDGMFVVKINI